MLTLPGFELNILRLYEKASTFQLPHDKRLYKLFENTLRMCLAKRPVDIRNTELI